MVLFKEIPIYPEEVAWLQALLPGSPVVRWLAGELPISLTVTAIRGDLITCGLWDFDKGTGAEVDRDLGWGPNGITGSYIRPPTQ